jgi:hypothetical protein
MRIVSICHRPLSFCLCLKFTQFIDFTVFGYKYIANNNEIGYIYMFINSYFSYINIAF